MSKPETGEASQRPEGMDLDCERSVTSPGSSSRSPAALRPKQVSLPKVDAQLIHVE